MNDLSSMSFGTPRKGDPALSRTESESYLTRVPEWRILEQDGPERLSREFKFKDFVAALNFTNHVGDLAEQVDHHPAILTEWGKVTVTWWTHVVNGLHINDFIAAAKTDQIYGS